MDQLDSQNPSVQPLSSGRWDASGSWEDAVLVEREKAFKWASGLSLRKLHWAVTVMASDPNAFTLYERKAVLEVVALLLGEQVRNSEAMARWTMKEVENKDKNLICSCPNPMTCYRCKIRKEQ